MCSYISTRGLWRLLCRQGCLVVFTSWSGRGYRIDITPSCVQWSVRGHLLWLHGLLRRLYYNATEIPQTTLRLLTLFLLTVDSIVSHGLRLIRGCLNDRGGGVAINLSSRGWRSHWLIILVCRSCRCQVTVSIHTKAGLLWLIVYLVRHTAILHS